MTDKLALKRLTASDLTFFEWHFSNRNAGNQKAINLNADVFTGQLYPALDAVVRERQNKLGVDLWVAGPDGAEPVNLQRKIIKGTSYKNWRLDGEFVHNPHGTPERFNTLEPDDLVVFGFDGDLAPVTVTLVLVSRTAPKDRALFEGLNGAIGARSMVALEPRTLQLLCEELSVMPNHPVWNLVEDEDITGAAQGQAPAIDRLLKRRRPPTLTLEDLRKARHAAEETGRFGEALVNSYLGKRRAAGEISDFVWESDINAISPYDFLVDRGGDREKLEVKTTTGRFDREFHLSLGELREMARADSPYRIARLYDATEDSAKMRISQKLGEFGATIVAAFAALPDGVTPDGVTIVPDEAMFGDELVLEAPAADEQ